MRRAGCVVTMVVVMLSVAACARVAQRPERSLQGTWCLEREELLLTFFATDSVRVTSTAADHGVNGVGRYAKKDTMFVATITADSLEIVMGYRYTWKTDSTIEAQTLFVTINGDSVNVKGEPVSMRRCPAPQVGTTARPTERKQKRGDKKK